MESHESYTEHAHRWNNTDEWSDHEARILREENIAI